MQTDAPGFRLRLSVLPVMHVFPRVDPNLIEGFYSCMNGAMIEPLGHISSSASVARLPLALHIGSQVPMGNPSCSNGSGVAVNIMPRDVLHG